MWSTAGEFFFGGRGIERRPSRALPVEDPRSVWTRRVSSGLRVTWLGHSTTLLEVDGARVLTDPVWGERVSPVSFAGPRRFHPPPVPVEGLPPLDAVLVSHDHFDHLDHTTIRQLARRETPFVTSLGVGAHLEAWGVDRERITELDWWESAPVGRLRFHATPARHFSGRRLNDRDATLWCSWVIASPRHRVFYSGDSGYFEGYRAIGDSYGPFDLTLMSLGAYGPTWPLIHMNPEELVQAQQDLRGELLLPVHWATFNLAFHAWNEPAIRMANDARTRGVRYAIPRPGQMVEPAAIVESKSEAPEWWRN